MSDWQNLPPPSVALAIRLYIGTLSRSRRAEVFNSPVKINGLAFQNTLFLWRAENQVHKESPTQEGPITFGSSALYFEKQSKFNAKHQGKFYGILDATINQLCGLEINPTVKYLVSGLPSLGDLGRLHALLNLWRPEAPRYLSILYPFSGDQAEIQRHTAWSPEKA